MKLNRLIAWNLVLSSGVIIGGRITPGILAVLVFLVFPLALLLTILTSNW
jgi:hypothetical protein